MSKALSNSESQNPELATLEGKQENIPNVWVAARGKDLFHHD